MCEPKVSRKTRLLRTEWMVHIFKNMEVTGWVCSSFCVGRLNNHVISVGFLVSFAVAPFVGAWIEMSSAGPAPKGRAVAPFVGAWIEIKRYWPWVGYDRVAPFVGAWIEIA